ncbi:serine hydrolase domain-containing protein [Neolewinella persica]|uniref:serine hydrolase domain-containing protein n=1 Tax=Neolewinella persica TaxID=70998 RepID=UPI00037CEF3C|nr:serine hydrolase domain-containing protein [Neolewinella persica]
MKTLLLLILLSFGCGYLLSQSLTPEQTKAINKAFMADIPDGGPGGAIGIIRNGNVVYTQYAGLADLDTKRAIDGQTRFNIASNAKQFTAIATLKLAREGKLNLKDDIREYFPELYPDIKEAITVANLLNHTSGIRDVYNLWSFQGITWWKKTLTNDDALELIRNQRELNFTPGTQHLYSNTNYILLTYLVAKVSGKSFREYTDGLFKSLGMTNTNFVSDHNDMGPNVGRPYFNFDTWSTYKWRTDLHGDGSLFSTLEDQLAWEVVVQKGETACLEAPLLSQSQLPVNTDADYGFGLERGAYRGVPVRWHDGSTGAWDASFIRFPEQHLTVVASDNSGKFGTSMLVRTIADIVLKDVFTEDAFLTEPKTVRAEIPVEKLLGTYLADNGYAFIFKLVDGKLMLERDGRSDNELELEEGNIYRQKFDPAFKQEFTWDEEKGMQVTAYYWAHAPYSLTRSNVDWKGYDFAGLKGEFYNDELDVSFDVSYAEGQQYQIKSGKENIKGEMYKRDQILAGGGNNIKVVRDASGQVTTLLVSDERTKNLRFVRK